MYYIGIDVGLNGSICILNNKGKLEKSLKMPVVKIEEGAYKHWYNLNEIIDLFNNYKDSKIILEYQRPMPGQGSVSMFRLGRGFGLLEGITTTIYKDNVIISDPKLWQNYLSNKYLTKDISNAFKTKTLNYAMILDTIADDIYKTWFLKYITMKSTSPAKVKSSYLYYIINSIDKDTLDFKDNNIVDAYLIAKYCYLHNL